MRLRLIIAFLLLGLQVRAQDRVGSITGTITDPDGRAVRNAPVQASNMATATVYRATTSASGSYTVTKLPVGTRAQRRAHLDVPGVKLARGVEL